MRFYFTRHSKQKFTLARRYGFRITRKLVKKVIKDPATTEDRTDDIVVSMSLIDKKHVLRVVHRREADIIIVITFYPGRRKEYGL